MKELAQAHHAEADAKPFWMKFFEVFGIQARTVGSYEVHVKKLDQALGKIDFSTARYLWLRAMIDALCSLWLHPSEGW